MNVILQNLPQIGANHAALKDFIAYRDNLHGNPERLLPIEGLWANNVALKQGLEIRTAFICPEMLKSPEYEKCAEEIVKKAQRSFVISEKVFDKISDRDGPSGIASVVKPTNFYTLGEDKSNDSVKRAASAQNSVPEGRFPPEAGNSPGFQPRDMTEKILDSAKRIVIMDAVEIPGNVGTILRALDGLGESALVLTNKRVRLTHPKVVKGSLGAIFTVPLITADLEKILKYISENKIPLFAADSSDKALVIDFAKAQVPERFALVLGSEKYGLPQEIYDAKPTGIRIPMAGVCDSLNVSIAGAILLYGLVHRKNE